MLINWRYRWSSTFLLLEQLMQARRKAQSQCRNLLIPYNIFVSLHWSIPCVMRSRTNNCNLYQPRNFLRFRTLQRQLGWDSPFASEVASSKNPDFCNNAVLGRTSSRVLAPTQAFEVKTLLQSVLPHSPQVSSAVFERIDASMKNEYARRFWDVVCSTQPRAKRHLRSFFHWRNSREVLR